MKLIKGRYWKYQGEEYEIKLVPTSCDQLITRVNTWLPKEHKFSYETYRAQIYIEQNDAIAKLIGDDWIFSTPEEYLGATVSSKRKIFLRLQVDYNDLFIKYEEINSCQVCNKPVETELMFEHSGKWHCFDCSMGFNKSHIEAVQGLSNERYDQKVNPYQGDGEPY